MKNLNFYPYYEHFLRSRQKTTTFRLAFPDLKEGEWVMLTLGWDENQVVELHPVRIKQVYSKPISELNSYDFEGESPDCKSSEATRLVLCSIYRTLIKEQDEIWVVKFDHDG